MYRNLTKIQDPVKQFRPGTSFCGIDDVQHISILPTNTFQISITLHFIIC